MSRPPPAATSTSTSLTTTSNGSHQFSIAGYSLSKGIGVGKFVASEAFDVGGHRWAVYFYPDGKAPGDGRTTYVSLFVALVSDETDVRALFELTLLDQSGKGLHKVHTHFGRSLQTGPYMLKCRGSMWGYKRFFKRDALDTSHYVKDDCLLVHCNVWVVKSSTEAPKSWYITVPSSNMGEQFGDLLESGKGADVCFEIEGEVFLAHKLVLAARSPVFRAQFFGPLKDHNKSLIKIDDMEAPIFKALLHFMYHDALPDIREFSGKEDPKLVSTTLAQHLLAAADRYGLERLILLCEAQLCEEISTSTVATTLALAEQHHCFHLKAASLRFIASQENLRAVMKTEGFEHLKVSCPSLMTELLKHVAMMDEQSVSLSLLGNKESDCGGANLRRVKQRLILR